MYERKATVLPVSKNKIDQIFALSRIAFDSFFDYFVLCWHPNAQRKITYYGSFPKWPLVEVNFLNCNQMQVWLA